MTGLRVFVASLATETNTFSPIRIDKSAFEDSFYAPPGQHPETPTLCSAAFVAARRRARTDGFTLIEGTATWAEPAGLVSRAAYEDLRDEILDQLARALPVQVALFGLHGAMMAEGYDDCEGDLLARARAIVGPDAVIGVELDPHCHLTHAMIQASTVIVTFKEVPHRDFAERAEDMVDLALRAARGDIDPVMSVLDCRAIANFMTSRSPGRELVDDMLAMERRGEVLSASVVHGFPAADMADVGTKILVITDGDRTPAGASPKRSANGCSVSAPIACPICPARPRPWTRRWQRHAGPSCWRTAGTIPAAALRATAPSFCTPCSPGPKRLRRWEPSGTQ